MRVFLDTNVLVSAFATRGVCADVLRVVLAEHTLVTSEVVLGELFRALRTRLKLPARTIHEIEMFLRAHEVHPRPEAPSPIEIRDPADRWVLASAVDARAELLVTGDRDLLDVAADLPVKIVNPRAFWDLMRRP
ncbi:MAG: putative toxin-antitoxin system toxin component, PIN family [Planctomycetes bacterium]|nr:putative toxin-antitoxin system toxin component, PIN family [Planctomycetota bacterium]